MAAYLLCHGEEETMSELELLVVALKSNGIDVHLEDNWLLTFVIDGRHHQVIADSDGGDGYLSVSSYCTETGE